MDEDASIAVELDTSPVVDASEDPSPDVPAPPPSPPSSPHPARLEDAALIDNALARRMSSLREIDMLVPKDEHATAAAPHFAA
jgi:hypothetical protein